MGKNCPQNIILRGDTDALVGEQDGFYLGVMRSVLAEYQLTKAQRRDVIAGAEQTWIEKAGED